MITKSLLLKCLMLITLTIVTSCSKHEISEDIQKIDKSNQTIEKLELQSKSVSTSSSLWLPFIEDKGGKSISQVATNSPFYLTVDTTLCNCDWISSAINIYLYKVTASGNIHEYTIGTNVASPVGFQGKRYEIILPNTINTDNYIIKITPSQADIPNGISGNEESYTNNFTVINLSISTSIVPNGEFNSNNSWVLGSGGNISNGRLNTPDMYYGQSFIATSSYFTISSDHKYLILPSNFRGSKLEFINSNNQIKFTYEHYGSHYYINGQIKSFNIPEGSYKIKLTSYGEYFADTPEEADGLSLNYIRIH